MIDQNEIIEELKNKIQKVGQRISYGLRTTDFQHGCLVGEAIAYGKLLNEYQERFLSDLNGLHHD